ncbi:MAG: hypothetical protein Kow0058_16390 [Roseovarius sp.]
MLVRAGGDRPGPRPALRRATVARMTVPAAAAALLAVAGCAREDEAGMRARLTQWFALGPTQTFAARADCAVGIFALVDESIGAALPVVDSVPQMLRMIDRQGRAALDDPQLAPDAAMVEIVNSRRGTGYALRRAALEARLCMDAPVRAAFRAALTSPAAMLAYDSESGTLMMIDRAGRRVLAAMGAQ